ncbi:hypothetical protein [Aliihoeflea sp. 2WW]|uniref:hypothetical protein n=1 Tax=Aliihoeflea sp. 2WW TaxID=1381123 RepID=UPI000463368B|nr:hypothetical protein [Aliihoeflea sp. 2WW]
MIRTVTIVTGLALAFLTAAATLLLPALLGTFLTGEFTQSMLGQADRVTTIVLILAAYALIPALNFVVLAEWRRWRHWLVYVATGAFIPAPIGLLTVFNPRASEDGLSMAILFSIAGAVGAFAYWLVAGRNAGRWRDEPSAPAS